jgi:pimeloyl-ACP methyl ester carboxylesterase
MKSITKLLTVSSIAVLLLSSSAVAQRKDAITKLPDPESKTLMTQDFVSLHCTFYPGGVIEGREKKFSRKSGKEVVPVILLHGWDGQRGDYDALASYLQKYGHAVMVPDLRGHGRSTTRKFPNGRDIEIDRKRMRRDEINSIVKDVEAVKKFLLARNNLGELNIEMLCIVGAEMGAIVGVNYAALDWARPQLLFQKQGRDVKALALLSPPMQFKGASLAKALASTSVMSVMLVVGKEDRESYGDAKQIHKRLQRFHKEPEPSDNQKQTLFLIEKATNLQGTQLVHPRFAKLNVHADIKTFIQLRLLNNKDSFTWKERKNPLDNLNE